MISFDTTEDCRPHIDEMLKKGIIAVGRYYTHKHDSWKILTKGEAQALSDAGIGIYPVYQDRNNQDADFSASDGKDAGEAAIEYANIIGQPKGSAIYFAVDYDASDSAIKDNIVPYFESVKKVFDKDGHFDVGVYGSGDTCSALSDLGLVKYTWLTQSVGFSGSKQYAKDLNYNIKQLLPENFLGMDVDPNEINLKKGYFGTFILGEDAKLV
jgi:hypothetical protein